MGVISAEVASDHLKADGDDQRMIDVYLNAAEESAMQFLNRRFYATEQDLLVARAAVPEKRRIARAEFEEAIATAEEISNLEDRASAIADAQRVLRTKLDDCAMVSGGMVINEAVESACLLILGHLYTNREDSVTGVNAASVIELPRGSRSLLWPYRIHLGV